MESQSQVCTVLEIQPDDDFDSVRHRIGLLNGERALLVLSWDTRFLSRELDFGLLNRQVQAQKVQVAIVSPDPARRQLARACGFSAFPDIERAQQAREWSIEPPPAVAPPPQPWWKEKPDLRPRPVQSRPTWLKWTRIGLHVTLFLTSLAVIAGSAYTVVPSGTVTLVPAGSEFVTIVPVSADPDVESVDHQDRLIPARRVGVEVEGSVEVPTTGTVNAVAGRTTGTVLFTNLLAQPYTVPAGTILRTSSTSYPIRFRTTADVAVPAGGQATVPIEALDARVGNVGAFQINQVEGLAASAVRVINPEPTTGGELREVRAVTQADYDRAWDLLSEQLLDQAYVEMGDYLEANEILLRQSLLIVGVPKEAYSHFLTEQTDKVGLNMRLQVRGLAVDVDNAEAVAYTALSQRLPDGYQLVDASFSLGEVAEEDIGPGWFTFFVTARGYAAAALDPNAAADLVRGQPITQASELLQAEFPLAEPPRITIWPDRSSRPSWLERLPLLSLRIEVDVVPQEPAES